MKRFYNNTLMSGAFSKALRVVALLCVLLGFSSSAWGAKYYIDASCISGVQQISWLQATGGNSSGDLIPQHTTFDGKSAFQFEANSGTIVRMQLKISSNGQVKYPAIHNISLSSSNCIELSYDGNNLGHTMKTYSTLKCAGGCTPSATITGAEYKNGNINLSGTLTETCSKDTYYGWQYKTSASGDWEAYISGTGGKDNSSQSTKDYSYAWNNGGNLVAGTTYYFRAYATYDAKTWYSDNKTLSVTIPTSEEEEEEESNCDKIIYLRPGVWEHKDGQRYAAYFFEGSSNDVWINMTATTSCDGLYFVEIPEGGYKKVLFGRMNPNSNKNSFIHKDDGGPMYNQTVDCSIEEGKNQYNITDWGDKKSTVSEPIVSTCTEGCTIPGSGSLVLSTKPIVNKQNKVATVSAYFRKNSNCKTISEYGFVYCTTATERPCDPSASSVKVTRNGSLERGQEYSLNITDLEDGLTYYYRAYIKFADGSTMLSKDVNSFAMDPCIPQECCGTKAIVYTIDATFSKDNLCKLQFRNLQTAIDHLRETSELESDNKFKYVTKSGDSYNLNQPVEMRVVYYDDTPDDPTKAYCYKGGTEGIGQSAGKVKPTNIVLIKDFNKTNETKTNTLTIKAGSKNAKPWVHHITIRQSKNIVLDSLAIFSDPSGAGDNALEIDVVMDVQTEGSEAGNPRWEQVTEIGQFSDANILVQNSMIGSAGFTGVHISCYDGITFKNNEFEAIFSGNSNDDINWGASAKFIFCKNIKFIQNNFRGEHATLMWIQECTNMLTMNNVYWNTNQYAENCTAIRLVDQFGKTLGNVGFYYNTFYLAEDSKQSQHKYDFLHYSNVGKQSFGKVEFIYNNCYSYDTQVSGKHTTPQEGETGSIFCPNNFWSEYDQIKYNALPEYKKAEYVSAFAFGCADNEFINVKSQVCSTTASGPASLIVKGKGMDYGVKPNISTTGITLEPNEQYADRYIIGARPAKGEKWTYGAYQSKDEIPTQTIYWVGKTSDWDDRNNWEYETEVAGQMVRQRVSCVNTLSEDLKVVIEEIGTVEIQGGRKWPVIPASFTENRTNSDYGEHVSAGLGTGKTPTKFASYIELEHGAGIIGVEHLKEGETLRYDSASTKLQAPLKQWMLVGPVIKPFKSGSKTEVRNVVSNDYYLERFPAVQMHGANIEGNNVSWGATFPDLDKSVVAKSAYAIRLQDAFGTYKLPAEYYDMKYGTNYTDFKSHTYTFKGRFYNENALPNYDELEAGVPILLNNTYPANIDAYELNRSGKGTVQLYNYSTNAFDAEPDQGRAILSQHAFVFTPAKNGDFVIDNTTWFLNSITRHRSGSDVLPTCRVQVKAIRSNTASNVVLTVDELKDDEADYATDAPKIFNNLDGKNELTIPDIYVMRYNKQWSGIRIPSIDEAIPLGVRINHTNAELEFSLVSKEELGDIILEDRQEGKKYNLSKGEKCYVNNLEVGYCEGRFFINLSDKTDEDTEDNTDDNISTEIEDSASDNGICIITKENSVVISCSDEIELNTIYISDMSGKTAMFNVSGQYAEIELPVAQGVYTVNVIGDTATKTGKVILK